MPHCGATHPAPLRCRPGTVGYRDVRATEPVETRAKQMKSLIRAVGPRCSSALIESGAAWSHAMYRLPPKGVDASRATTELPERGVPLLLNPVGTVLPELRPPAALGQDFDPGLKSAVPSPFSGPPRALMKASIWQVLRSSRWLGAQEPPAPVSIVLRGHQAGIEQTDLYVVYPYL